MKKALSQITLLICVFALLQSCDMSPSKNVDSYTSGLLKLGVDDSYSLMADSQVNTYTGLNKFADIKAEYKPEASVIADLLNDSIQAAIISRPLSDQEMAYFKSINRMPESILIAYDGIALVVNPANPDTVLNMNQLRNIMEGKDSTWSQLSKTSKLGNLQVVFDNNLSCNSRTLTEKFGLTAFPSYCFAVHNNEEVIKYVNTHPNAIGVISMSWISDQEDPISRDYSRQIKTIGLIDSLNQEKPEMPRKPHQAYVFDRSYPLRREVYYIRTGLSGSLGTGFANHLRGDKGQLIIHKMGMVAASTPTRIIKVTQ